MYGCKSWTGKKAECWRIDAFELWCWRRLLRVPWTQGNPTSPFSRKSVLGVHWKDWCWGWNSNTLATSCEELTHWKRPWCWKGLWAGGEGDDWGWDGWMASPTRWMWVWVNSRSWWWTGRPGMLRFMGSQRAGHDWTNELNWTELIYDYVNYKKGQFYIFSFDLESFSYANMENFKCKYLVDSMVPIANNTVSHI